MYSYRPHLMTGKCAYAATCLFILSQVGQQTVNGWWLAIDLCRGIAKLVKALDFDSSMRRFESFFPCQIFFWRAHYVDTYP